jgi:hypothetical protein
MARVAMIAGGSAPVAVSLVSASFAPVGKGRRCGENRHGKHQAEQKRMVNPVYEG